MKPVLVLVPLLVLGAVAALLLLDSGDAPGGARDAAPSLEEAAPAAAAPAAADRPGDSPTAAAGAVREAVVLTEDGDVADLPPDALRTATLSVRVEDADGRPLSGAAVTLAAGFPGRAGLPVPFVDFEAEEETGAGGVASFHVPPVGVYTARATHPGFAPGELGPVVPGDEVALRLEPGETLVGSVADAATGLGIEGAIVRLERGNGHHESPTDADGAFTVVDLEAGRYRLRVYADGYDVLVQNGLDVPAEDGPLELEMRPGVALSGVVVERGAGTPVAGARVELEGGGRIERLALPEPAITGGDGTFAFGPPLSRRGLRLVVSAPGFATERRGVNAKPEEAETEVEVELVRGVTVAGRVTSPDGAPVAGAAVRLRAASLRGALEAETDAGGRFAFEGLRTGDELRLVAGAPESGFAPAVLEPRVVEEGEERVELDVVLPAGGRLDGEVRDGAGAPVAKARVLVEGLDGETWKLLEEKPVLFTDEEGRFSLAGLPEATLELSAEHQGWIAPATSLTIVPGGAHVLTLGLEQGAILGGVVVDARGGPVDDALVTAHAVGDDFELPRAERVQAALERRQGARDSRRERRGRGGGSERWTPAARLMRAATGGREQRLTGFRALARTDSAGRFELRGLMPGETLALVVRKSGHEPRHEFGVDPSRGGVRIVLPSLVELTGRVVDAATRRPLTAFRVRAEPIAAATSDASIGDLLSAPSVRQRMFRSEDGTFALGGLQSGAWTVTVSADEYRRSEPVRIEVAKGLTGDVLLEAVPAAAIEVRVKAAGGAPVAGLTVTLRPKGEGGRPMRRRTGGEGRVSFEDPPPGEYEIVAGRPNAPLVDPVIVRVLEGERVVRELGTAPLGTLVVDVRSGSGFGIPRARVRVRGLDTGVRRTVRADDRGRVRVDRLLPEQVEVTAMANGHEPQKHAATVQPGASQDLTFHLTPKP